MAFAKQPSSFIVSANRREKTSTTFRVYVKLKIGTMVNGANALRLPSQQPTGDYNMLAEFIESEWTKGKPKAKPCDPVKAILRLAAKLSLQERQAIARKLELMAVAS